MTPIFYIFDYDNLKTKKMQKKFFIRYLHTTRPLKMDDWDQYDLWPDLQGDGYPVYGGPLDNEGRPMTPFRQALEEVNPNFKGTWLEPLSYDNCLQRRDFIWVSVINEAHQEIKTEYNEELIMYLKYREAYLANLNKSNAIIPLFREEIDPNLKEKLDNSLSILKERLTRLELLDKVKTENLIPSKQSGYETIKKVNELLDEHYNYSFESISLSLIKDDKFNYKIGDYMVIPQQGEIDQLKDISTCNIRKMGKISVDQLHDLVTKSRDNEVKIQVAAPGSNTENPRISYLPQSRKPEINFVQPSPPQSPQSSLTNLPNQSFASSSNSNPRRSSGLAIDWKPDLKGKKFSTLSFNFNKRLYCTDTRIKNGRKLNKKITGDYIAGFVQADGSFSAVLTSKTRNSKRYFNISLVFTIVQHEKYKDLILEIQKCFGGIGNWYFNKSDKTIRYQVTKQSDLLNVIIPFFMKYQLRSGKLISFLHFKYIVEVMSTRAHWNNMKLLLSLIVIASHLNPLGKLGNKIRYLTPDEQYYVVNNIQPDGIDISKLTESIKNFKQNKLTLDFIHGLFDGDGGLSLSLLNPRKAKRDNNIITVKPNFTIVQDLHNISLLDELKKYFNDKGCIHKLSNNCSIYSSGSKSDLITVILPKMADKEPNDLLNKYSLNELNLPLIKYKKIYYVNKVLELDLIGLKNEQALNEVIVLLYNIINNTQGLTLKQYEKIMKNKLMIL